MLFLVLQILAQVAVVFGMVALAATADQAL
jgi:hypothetical protein